MSHASRSTRACGPRVAWGQSHTDTEQEFRLVSPWAVPLAFDFSTSKSTRNRASRALHFSRHLRRACLETSFDPRYIRSLPLTASWFFLLIPTAQAHQVSWVASSKGDMAISGRRMGTSGAYDGVPWGYISVPHPLMVTEVIKLCSPRKTREDEESAAYVALATYWRRLAPPWHGTTLWG
jgi:hypothetical protein